MRPWRSSILTALLAAQAGSGAPVYLENQFEIPAGFRIYRAATSALTGGSYDITFDGQGRLLVGDGAAVRRLSDQDGDGVYDRFEVIARGLGGRGPQGLLVYGDSLYAVGGDGVQLFEGYQSQGPLLHRGRIGAPFQTGGDHAAHTILRGHDGCLYLVTGNGAGAQGRRHITEKSSPASYEREACVFRISPDGRHWECVATGGRNAPSLGMNYLGELFSWDSDMEWHVDLPWYRPLRLNHWILGSDQGWQDVGAYPDYYIDALPPVLATGRGSPTWGVFYEHNQFPPRFRDAFLVCDYLWKSASTGNYDTVGRVVVFNLRRHGPGWQADMELFIRPRPGARDAQGRSINFALVDAEVAPDGSLFISDHNQGVWRVFYDPARRAGEMAPPIVPRPAPLPASRADLIQAALQLPQPGSEWARLQLEAIRSALGDAFEMSMRRIALDAQQPLRARLQALNLIAARYAQMPDSFLNALSEAGAPELRGHAAWLSGLRAEGTTSPLLIGLLKDSDSLVRRRAAEAMTRTWDAAAVPGLIQALTDPERLVRYVAMTALARRPAEIWFTGALQEANPQAHMRALIAAHLRQMPPDPELTRRTLRALMDRTDLSKEDQLDLLRLLGVYREAAANEPSTRQTTEKYLLSQFPDPDNRIRWEQIRLLGQCRIHAGFGQLLALLQSEQDPVTQFHIAQALARLEGGWTEQEARQLKTWFVQTQTGWFADFSGKGHQFPDFWATVLAEYAAKHREILLADLSACGHAQAGLGPIQFSSLLGRIVLEQLLEKTGDLDRILSLYRAQNDPAVRRVILERLRDFRRGDVARFLREEHSRVTDPDLQAALLRSLSRMPPEEANRGVLAAGLTHPDLDTALACGQALARHEAELNRTMADALMNQMIRHPDAARWISPVLAGLTRAAHPDWLTHRDDRREGPAPARIREYWEHWYARRFDHPFKPSGAMPAPPKPNEALLDFLIDENLSGGSPEKGRELFARAQCQQCHSPGAGGRLFGPDLAGVTRRLQRAELAEAIVYPSKQVAERYQATEIDLKDGTALTGFITEDNDQIVTFSTQDSVRQIPRSQIESILPQTLSLMPEGLLAGMSWEEIRDLYAYLDSLGAGEE